MSDEEIERAIRDAEQYAAEDSFRRDTLTVCGEAQVLLSNVEQALSSAGKQIEKEEKKRIKEDCNTLRKLISKAKPEKMIQDDVYAIRSAMQQLEASSANVRATWQYSNSDDGKQEQ